MTMSDEMAGFILARALVLRCEDLDCSGLPFSTLKPGECVRCVSIREFMQYRTQEPA